ncbi:hypothetical protein H5993_00640 [Lactobacillus alvi]|uniref:Uncharacterized protein n=1 Tax=Limosilactobacillus alvi TaxID=990412 RepID=A0ABS2EMJ0_9LACO|nr:hypothetical protein [Limosilactobacillus alvi]MBM6753276.1 hypothetical protein [Limosilactobacillus alvi]
MINLNEAVTERKLISNKPVMNKLSFTIITAVFKTIAGNMIAFLMIT